MCQFDQESFLRAPTRLILLPSRFKTAEWFAPNVGTLRLLVWLGRLGQSKKDQVTLTILVCTVLDLTDLNCRSLIFQGQCNYYYLVDLDSKSNYFHRRMNTAEHFCVFWKLNLKQPETLRQDLFRGSSIWDFVLSISQIAILKTCPVGIPNQLIDQRIWDPERLNLLPRHKGTAWGTMNPVPNDSWDCKLAATALQSLLLGVTPHTSVDNSSLALQLRVGLNNSWSLLNAIPIWGHKVCWHCHPFAADSHCFLTRTIPNEGS